MAGVLAGSALVGTIWTGIWFRATRSGGIISADFERAPNPFQFIQWDRKDAYADIEPDSVFATLNGRIQARFSFSSADRTTLSSVGVSDSSGRPWVDVDLTNGRYFINIYAASPGTLKDSPDATLYATPGSTSPDRTKNWRTGELLCLEKPLEWRPCEPVSRPDDPSD